MWRWLKLDALRQRSPLYLYHMDSDSIHRHCRAHFHGSFGVRDGESAVTMRHPIFQYNQCDALFVEVRCPVIAFVVDSQSAISATRTGYYGTACRQFGSRKEDAEQGVSISNGWGAFWAAKGKMLIRRTAGSIKIESFSFIIY